MIVIGDHMKQFPIIVLGRAPIAEEGFVYFFAVNRKWLVFCAISPQSSAVLIDIFIVGGLIHVPNSTITFRLG